MRLIDLSRKMFSCHVILFIFSNASISTDNIQKIAIISHERPPSGLTDFDPREPSGNLIPIYKRRSSTGIMARYSKSKATAHLNKQESTRRAAAIVGEESGSATQVVQHNRRSKVLAGSICKKSPTRSSARLVNKRNGTIGLQAPKATIHDLPIELRVEIMKYLLCSAKEIEDVPDALSSRCEMQTPNEEPGKFANKRRYQLHLQILKTNFQLFHEGQYLLYRSGNRKYMVVTYNIAPKSEIRCCIAGESSVAQALQKHPVLRNVK